MNQILVELPKRTALKNVSEMNSARLVVDERGVDEYQQQQ